MKEQRQPSRLAWIDWMKTMAMYLIIAGHSGVPYSKYIYVFSVPCFFIISGFLTKHEGDIKLFWGKLWWNLIVPMIIFACINMLYVIGIHILDGTFNAKEFFIGLITMIIGQQGQNTKGLGLGVLWFVYTLAICKILFQFTPQRRRNFWLIVESVVCLLGAIVLCHLQIAVYNSWANVLLAMPFFTIGLFLQHVKKAIVGISLTVHLVLIIVGCMFVFVSGTYNDVVLCYRCSFGGNMALCLLGGVGGTLVIYSLSMLLQPRLTELIKITGGGGLIILGLHGNIFLRTINHITNQKIYGGWLYIESLLILLIIVPIIILIKRYLPILYGVNRLK